MRGIVFTSMSRKTNTEIVAVPRAVLAALVALIIVPWLITWGIAAWNFEQSAERVDPSPGISSASVDPGPWGRLTVSPILISPPLEYVPADMGPITAPEWHFPQVPRGRLAATLAAAGLSDGEVSRAMATAQPDPQAAGMLVRPDAELVRGLSPDGRARLYGMLAKSPLNFDQQQAYRFRGRSAEDWLRGSRMSASTRQLVEPLIYRNGPFLHFADIETIRPQIGRDEDVQFLVKTLVRQATMLVRLSVDDASEIDRLSEYWGRGGRRTDIRPLLESVAGGGMDRLVDIVHLLPALARNNLYRYPRPTTADLQRPVLANCLWTSLNFFGADPDDRFLDVNLALKSLENDYYNVEHGYQLGDIVAFVDEEGNLFHVAVYLADNLVFSKNGMSPMAPWLILTLDDVKGYYLTHSTNPKLIFHRRKDL